MIALLIALPIGWLLLGHRVGWHRAAWRWAFGEPIWSVDDLRSNRVPLPRERSNLTAPEPVPAGVEGIAIGRRETPAPVPPAAVLRSSYADGTSSARGQDPACDEPCTARHCRHNAPGTAAQNGGHAHTEAVRAALFTATEEWPTVAARLGFFVPVDLSEMYQEAS